MIKEFNFYNPDDKNEFLNQYENIDTQESYGYILERTKNMEEFYNKDFYEFNMDQIEELMYDLKPSSLSVARMSSAVLSAYLSWSIDNNKRMSNINPLKTKAYAKEWQRKFIDTSKKNYISLEELEDIEERLVNAQDRVIPRLIFEGINGVFASEIVNLREKDIKEEKKKLRLNDDKRGERYVTVSEDCIKRIKEALKAKDYQKQNGNSTAKNPVLDLVENDYVVKTVDTNTTSTGRADKFTVYRRVAGIADNEKGLGIPYFTTKSIQRSGMIYMAYKLMKEQGKIEVDRGIIAQVSDHFLISKVANGYNFTALEEYINMENIKELYNI